MDPIPVAPTSKDPDATLPYGLWWGAWLPEGDTIAASSWEIDKTEEAEDLAFVVAHGGAAGTFDDETTTAWVTGGVVNRTYRMTNRITTVGGIVDERSIRILVVER